MFGVTTSDDYQPVTWVGRHPIHVTTLVVGLHVFAAVVACVVGPALIVALGFDSELIWQHAQLWRVATYAWVHLPTNLLWFAVEMYMLFVFGREVERFVGRKAFITLYLVLLLAPTVLLTLWGLGKPVGIAGSPALHFGIFIAFTTIYPNVELLLRIQAKWIALTLAAISTLQLLYYRDWPAMVVLWLSIASAFAFVRFRGAGPELEWWSNLKSRWEAKPKFHIVQKSESRRTVEPENIHESIDPVLEKISKYGINSLTASERRALDRARNRLLKKPQ
jgi:membrane associated rhomboid family serine protease